MADILCPICNRVNNATSERCWYCQAVLPQEQAENAGQNFSEEISGERSVNQPNSDHGKGDEDVPEWLERIRALEKEDRESSESINPIDNEEQNQQEDIPDWLKDFRLEGDSEPDTDQLENRKEPGAIEAPDFSLRNDLTNQPLLDETDTSGDALDSLLAELGIGAEEMGEEEPDSTLSEEPEISFSGNDDIDFDFLQKIGVSERTESENLPISSEPEKLVPENKAEQQEPDAFLELLNNEKNTAAPTPPDDFWKPLDENEPKFDTETPFEFLEEPKLSNGFELEPETTPDIKFEIEEEPKGEPALEPEPADNIQATQTEEWKRELPHMNGGGILPPDNENPELLSFDNDDLPEWLTFDESVSEKSEAKEPSATTGDLDKKKAEIPSKLERAQLPAWLHAIRPVEAVTPIQPLHEPSEEKAQHSEEGIFAGLEGVLRTPDLSEQMKKPRVYSSVMEVNARQQQNAALFSQLLDGSVQEGSPETPARTVTKSNLLLRILVTIALLAAVVLPYFSTTGVGVSPVLFPSEVVSTFSEIQGLQAGTPVLLAAHFEAGLAGEMSWISRSILEHLMARGIPMAVLSTNAIGYAVLEDEIRDAGSTETGFALDSQVVNFGYLPGGTLGILSLRENIRQTLPFTTALRSAWEGTALQNINNLSDFGAVIVFTDNADIVKYWVEQAGTSSNIPILAVVSAQAAPMTQPYYESGQIQGYVSGMNGSQSYEQIIQRPYDATKNFSSFQTTLLITAVIVFLGGAVSLILSSAAGTKREGRD